MYIENHYFPITQGLSLNLIWKILNWRFNCYL